MPKPVDCYDCGRRSVPMFWDHGQIYCRGCLKERNPEFEWPPDD